MPYKVFVAGQSATAAEANTYLMRQSVVQFPDYAAAVAAYVSPPAGAQFVLPDGTVWTWASGAWRTIPTRGRTSLTTDAGGYATITHGLGITPTVVIANGASPPTTTSVPGAVLNDTFTTTSFRVRVFNLGGVALGSATCTIAWAAWP